MDRQSLLRSEASATSSQPDRIFSQSLPFGCRRIPCRPIHVSQTHCTWHLETYKPRCTNVKWEKLLYGRCIAKKGSREPACVADKERERRSSQGLFPLERWARAHSAKLPKTFDGQGEEDGGWLQDLLRRRGRWTSQRPALSRRAPMGKSSQKSSGRRR